MTCYKRVLQISRYNCTGDKFPSVIKDRVTLNRPGLCRGSIILFLDGRRYETTTKIGVYICKKVGYSKYVENGYNYEAVKIGMLDTENIDFDDKFWYVNEFVKLNNRIESAFKQRSFWYRLFHRPLLVPELFCDAKNRKQYEGFI